jgi:hypothetical protein
VLAFYDAVERHQFARAASLWTASMRQRYPVSGNINGRFSRTTRIDVTSIRTVALNTRAGTATVAISLKEYRTVEPSPRFFTGSWDLVRTSDGRWLLNQPHF